MYSLAFFVNIRVRVVCFVTWCKSINISYVTGPSYHCCMLKSLDLRWQQFPSFSTYLLNTVVTTVPVGFIKEQSTTVPVGIMKEHPVGIVDRVTIVRV